MNETKDLPLVFAMDAFLSALSASLSGGLSTLLLFPLEKLKTRLASAPVKGPSLTVLVSELGVSGLYAGSSTKTVQSMMGKFLYFLYYSTLRKLAMGEDKTISALGDIFCGYIAELLQLPVTIPIEVISTRMQMKEGVNPRQAFEELWKQGPGALWKGLDWSVLCGFMPALQYALYEQFKVAVLAKQRGGLTSAQAFVLGAVARAIATVAVFPFTRAKVVAQSRNKDQKQTVLEILLEDVKKDGILSLYRGILPELLRGVLTAAIMMTLKERTDVLTRQFFYYLFSINPRASK